MQEKLIVITTAVALALAIFISTSDARHIHGTTTVSQPSPPHTGNTVGSKPECGPCQGSNFSNVLIRREDSRSYMFVDLLSTNECCNVIAKDSESVNPLDIRGKRLAT